MKSWSRKVLQQLLGLLPALAFVLWLSSCSMVCSLIGTFSYLRGVIVAGLLTVTGCLCAMLSVLGLGGFSDLYLLLQVRNGFY